MRGVDVVGWASSGVLVLTIARQVYRQWRSGTSEGVSQWLFAGQCAASFGFTVYSWLIGSIVFVVTNAVMLVSAVAGLALVFHHRKRERARVPAEPAGGREPTASRVRPPVRVGA